MMATSHSQSSNGGQLDLAAHACECQKCQKPLPHICTFVQSHAPFTAQVHPTQAGACGVHVILHLPNPRRRECMRYMGRCQRLLVRPPSAIPTPHTI